MKKKTHFKPFLLSLLIVLGNTPAQASLIVNPAQPITHRVTVQPIIISDKDGNNTANFFGTPTQQSQIEGLIDNIWAQAGIDVDFLMYNSWNNTFANAGSVDSSSTLKARPLTDIQEINKLASTAGITHSDPNVINMFFVNIPAGFSQPDDNTAAGVALLPGNVITQYVGTNLLTFPSGQDTIASVVAHEIGHNLGLPHLVEMKNLMQVSSSPFQGEQLNSKQITTALNSNLSVEMSAAVVPIPAAVWLFGTGLIGLISLTKTKKALTIQPA